MANAVSRFAIPHYQLIPSSADRRQSKQNKTEPEFEIALSIMMLMTMMMMVVVGSIDFDLPAQPKIATMAKQDPKDRTQHLRGFVLV